MKFTSYYISYSTSLLLLLTQIPWMIYLLVFISALPMTTAVSSERPFPDISFKDFSKFVNSNFKNQSETLALHHTNI